MVLEGDVAVVSGWNHARTDSVRGAVWVFALVGGEGRQTQEVVSTPDHPSRSGSSVDALPVGNSTGAVAPIEGPCPGALEGVLALGDGTEGGPLPPGSTGYLQAW